jgi:hypothetical protein
VPDPKFDGALELRRNGQRLEQKNGRHGSFGEWRPTSHEEAIAWLIPGAQYSAKYSRASGGEYLKGAKR